MQGNAGQCRGMQGKCRGMQGECGGNAGEMQGKCRGIAGEMQGNAGEMQGNAGDQVAALSRSVHFLPLPSARLVWSSPPDCVVSAKLGPGRDRGGGVKPSYWLLFGVGILPACARSICPLLDTHTPHTCTYMVTPTTQHTPHTSSTHVCTHVPPTCALARVSTPPAGWGNQAHPERHSQERGSLNGRGSNERRLFANKEFPKPPFPHSQA